MPKLCSLGYDYERTLAALEGAQERLTDAVERIGREVEAIKIEHWQAQDLLWRALRDNPGKTLLVGKHCYHLEQDRIVRTEPWYGHEEWVEEPEPVPAVLKSIGPRHDPMMDEIVIVGSREEVALDRNGNITS